MKKWLTAIGISAFVFQAGNAMAQGWHSTNFFGFPVASDVSLASHSALVISSVDPTATPLPDCPNVLGTRCEYLRTFSLISGNETGTLKLDELGAKLGYDHPEFFNAGYFSPDGKVILLIAFGTKANTDHINVAADFIYLFVDANTHVPLHVQSESILTSDRSMILDQTQWAASADRQHLVSCSQTFGETNPRFYGVGCDEKTIDWQGLAVSTSHGFTKLIDGDDLTVRGEIYRGLESLRADGAFRYFLINGQYLVETGSLGIKQKFPFSQKTDDPLRVQYLSDVDFSKDGKTIAVTTWSKLFLLNVESGKIQGVVDGEANQFDSFHFARFLDDGTLVSMHGGWAPWSRGDFSFRVWSTGDLSLKKTVALDAKDFSFPAALYFSGKDFYMVKGGYYGVSPFQWGQFSASDLL